MAHIPHFITDLALILAVAGVTTLFFKKIHQPVVLGYIIAGLLVGPHVSLFPTVMDSEGVRTWSEIGVIFLLFSLGLEFSFKKLVKVGGTASVTALVEVAIMFGLGLLTGKLLGWTSIDSLFLGAILSISSTTIIVRAFDETGVRTKKFATLVFGILIIQDLVAVLLMVLLSTFAASQQFSGYDLLIQILKLVFFLTLWFLAGIFFIPTFLKRARNLLNDETMLVVSIALCLLMVLLAVEVGFSAALGAFIMGSILAETSQGERIELLVKPVKNLFAAVFFVSVGMMIDPGVLQLYAQPILIITFIVIIGMPLATILGSLLSGQSLKHSIQAGMSLSQIGEFSFIIASLGVTLKVTSEFLYPIAVAVSAVTTFTTPFLIKRSMSVYTFAEKRLPKKWINSLNRYSTSSQQLSAYSEWKELLHSYFINAVIHAVLIGALIILSRKYIHPVVSELFDKPLGGNITAIVITLVLMIPSIWAISIRRINKEAYSNLWLNRKLNRGPLIAIEIGRIAMAVLLVGLMINQYFSPSVSFLIAVVAMAIATVLFNQKLQAFYDRIEKRFLSNLNDKEHERGLKQEITPWDAHLATFDVQPEFPLAGKQLLELKLREQYGVNIALIERGKLSLISPDRHERLYPGDKLSIIGTDDQLARMKDVFENSPHETSEQHVNEDEIALQNFTVTRESPLYQRTIRNSGIRDHAQGLVVGLERNGNRMLNPESTIPLEEGDIVWIVGVRNRIEEFFKGQSK
ncbi:cation:proton antiporter [Chryseolinea lacunae]|uniref:Cation:proton antiporter n=1 Tax=Chryseolinea lacunae TaxID=2801331 RepID=A0ABS1KZL4_9BACT|nr:cation:proton antiporter [Chryseolinea lacunae]MBL0744707.1 cation:proton antiporter [Chryseolinea lacunae]